MTQITANVTKSSHCDHLPAPILSEVLDKLAKGQSTVKVLIPGALAIAEVSVSTPVLCSLRGPTTDGKTVHESQAWYSVRGEGRPNVSRMTDLPATESTTVTVVVVGLETFTTESFGGNLATAYGGPLAPQEPGDPYLPADKLAESVAFWADHALSLEGSPATCGPIRGVTFATFASPDGSRAAAESAPARVD